MTLMAFILRTHLDQDQAIAVLEEMGIYGAVKKPDGTLRLYNRNAKRIDPETGKEVTFNPESQMTMPIRKLLNEKCWIVAHSSAFGAPSFFRG